MTRVWAERTEDTEVLNENFKEKLGLLRSNKQNAHRSLQQTFIKPSSRIIQVGNHGIKHSRVQTC